MKNHRFISSWGELRLKNLPSLIITALLASVTLGSGFFYSQDVRAYDEDIHFYMTYAVARYAGIDHYTAMYLGAGSQWIDVSAISSPMNPLLGIGTRMRRSNHFPANRRKVTATHAHGLGGIKFFSETRPNHPFGSDGVMAGMKLGDLLRVAYSTHRWQDTYAHAGNTAEFGHALLGHQPDRFFQETEKTQKMVRGLMMLMTRVRTLLPEVALDKEFRDGEGPAHLTLDSEKLAEKFLARQDVKDILAKDYLRDERYTRFTVEYLLVFYQRRGLIHDGIDIKGMISRLESQLEKEGIQLFADNEVRSILKSMFKAAMNLEQSGIDIINDELFEQILAGYPDREYVWSGGASGQGQLSTRNLTLRERIQKLGDDRVIDQLVYELTANVVPEDFSDIHKVEFEVEAPPRHRELSVRRRDFRDLIQNLYGRNVKFYEMHKMPKLGTMFSGLRRYLWKSQREAYWNEKLAAEVEESLRASMRVSPYGDLPEIATLPHSDRILYVLKHLQEDWFDWFLYYASFGKKGTKRSVAQPDALLWQYEEQFELMRKGGVVKPLLTPEEHAKIAAFFGELHRAYTCGELLVN